MANVHQKLALVCKRCQTNFGRIDGDLLASLEESWSCSKTFFLQRRKGGWDLKLRRNFNDWEMREIMGLQSLLNEYQPNLSRKTNGNGISIGKVGFRLVFL